MLAYNNKVAFRLSSILIVNATEPIYEKIYNSLETV